MFESVREDLTYGLRGLRGGPAFTCIALLTLALGIGATSAIFSFVDAVLLKPLPYDHPERIVSIDETSPDGQRNGGVSTLSFVDWQQDSASFSAMSGVRRINMTLSRAEPVILSGLRVSAGYFDIFGVKPALGRTFAPHEDEPGRDHVVVLSHRFWLSEFGADPSLVGRSITLDHDSYTVIGVMPAGTVFDRSVAEFWRPFAFTAAERTRNVHWFQVIGRLKPDVPLAQARAEMNGIAARISRDYPESNKNWGISVMRLSDVIVSSQLERSLWVLLVAVAMLLLIGCANLANLTLARGTSREREVAVRAALGASRARLVQQFLTENLLLALAGGALGIALGYGAMRALQAMVPPSMLPDQAVVTMDARVLAFAFALSLATGLVFGLLPALQGTAPDLSRAMKEGGRGSSGDSRRRGLRSAFVVAEFALAFILVTGGGLLLRSFFKMMDEPLATDESSVLTMWLPIPSSRFPDSQTLLTHLHDLEAHVAALPGVKGVAIADSLPLEGWNYGMPFLIAGSKTVDRAHRNGAGFKAVQPDYFRVLGIRVLQGRALNDHDVGGSMPVAVVNATFARRFFARQNPLGQHVLIQQIVPGQPQLGPEIAWEVVGVIADEHSMSLDGSMERPGVYVPFEQSPTTAVNLVVRTAVDPETLGRAAVAAIHEGDPTQVVSDVVTLDEIKRELTASTRLRTTLLVVFAGLALALAAIGVYGVISYAVAQRAHEIGVRAALGASPGSVLGLVLAGGLRLTVVGLAIGLGGALLLTRVLGSLMFGISPRDPLTLAASGIALTGVALVACYVPARRAARLDPLVVLRDG